MKKPIETPESLRDKIIGLGEHSVRKHHYTSLQERLDELERFRAILDQSKEMIFLGKEGKIFDINQAVATFYQCSKEEILGCDYEAFLPLCVTKKIPHLLKEHEIGEVAVLETEIYHTPFEFSLQAIVFQKEPYVIFFGSDISEKKRAEEEIHRLGNYDALTHLPNKNMLFERLFGLKQSCAKGIECGLTCKYLEECKYSALLLIDVDHFKELNDTEGHSQGDIFLKELARRIGSQLERGDFLCRFGGDEFVILMESLHVKLHEAISMVESLAFGIRARLNQPVLLGNTAHLYTSSIGVVIFRKSDTDDIVKQVEIAMYEAKNAGRNTIRFYDPKMQEAIKEKVALESGLRRAIAAKEFELYYQPKVNQEKKIIAFEALLRWQDPQKGVIAPSCFIPLAEESGLIIPIGNWVIQTACKQLLLWSDDPLKSSLSIAVNLSLKQLQDDSFVSTLKDILQHTQCPKEKLIFEITETVFMDDTKPILSKIHHIKNLGIRFSIDDFGTGFSSLSTIQKVPLDELKIDQSFIQNISHETDSGVIIRTIIGMANNLGLEVVAEGVETQTQFAFLKQAGCKVFQGYLFGKPLPLSEAECLL